ncbi:Rib7p [Sugiyamaella lignohabitans]|uniref:2,5-diamino-6-ribosylamino-4(3H)-pyrimidinone 5'-phosphate reductase n=1 Tax=Sugiyamaella lignohabitans TaxID=796027 RepID=A0A167FQQ7_9ASCO|nr:Rib7p [Sugiyamaella lignohabitans]ANB15575.1 Rib7p [Sugiyamaella lignohabitans]
MSTLVPLRDDLVPFLEPHLPRPLNKSKGLPFVTLTYAQSLDSMISAGKGKQTVISHLETKTMTHYLRSKHDGILVGAGTVVADDPGLNCRYKPEGDGVLSTPRPIVLDPRFRWNLTKESRVIKTATDGTGLAPWIIVNKGIRDQNREKVRMVESIGGKIIEIDNELSDNKQFQWSQVFTTLYSLGLGSIMVEGGATVINSLLEQPDLVDSVIITIGPVFLGNQGVQVSPNSTVALQNVSWWRGIQDSVLAGQLKK